MTDIYRKPTSGEPFVPNARQQAVLIAAAQRILDRLGQPLERSLDPGIILIRNDTGADLTDSHPVVGLGDPLILPADRASVVYEAPVFEGLTPDEDLHLGKFAVCLGPVKDDAHVRAVLFGWSWVKLTVNSSDHDEAEIIDGDAAKLQTVATGNGSAKILWRASSGTPRDAIVLVGCVR